MATEVLLPRLTDTMHQGMISYWYKKEGEYSRRRASFRCGNRQGQCGSQCCCDGCSLEDTC